MRWIADERIIALRDDLNALLDGPPPSRRYYLAVLGAIDWLSHEPKMTGNEIAGDLLVRELKNEKRSPETHALALSLLNPNDAFLSLDRLRDYLKSDYTPLRIEAARSLSQQASPSVFRCWPRSPRANRNQTRFASKQLWAWRLLRPIIASYWSGLPRAIIPRCAMKHVDRYV